jgi:hypothetical protein
MTILKFKKLQAILNQDLINKYLIETIYQIPRIKTINVQLDIKEVIEINKNSFNTIKEKPYKLKIFLLLFFYFLKIPFYKIQQFLKVTKSSKKLKLTRNFFEISSINKTVFNTLLFSLFIENNPLKTSKNINSLQKFLILPSKYNDSINIKFLLASQLFENIKHLGFFIFKNSTLKQLNFNLLLQLYNPNKIKNLKNLLYNMPFFWING